MGELKAKGKQHITLKEAARISGYAPDYLGQLIRKGKIPGEQVYSHVAWVTTEDAVRAYMDGTQRKGEGVDLPETAAKRAENDERLVAWVRALFSLVSGIAVVFTLFLFYVLSVSIDHRIAERAIAGTSSARVQEMQVASVAHTQP